MSNSALLDRRTRLPASCFPELADIYVCDACGLDITKYLRLPQSHSWRPLGPERYTCACGQRYLTGAVEWDHLGEWERRRRTREIIGLAVLLAVIGGLFGFVLYLALAAIDFRQFGLVIEIRLADGATLSNPDAVCC